MSENLLDKSAAWDKRELLAEFTMSTIAMDATSSETLGNKRLSTCILRLLKSL